MGNGSKKIDYKIYKKIDYNIINNIINNIISTCYQLLKNALNL